MNYDLSEMDAAAGSASESASSAAEADAGEIELSMSEEIGGADDLVEDSSLRLCVLDDWRVMCRVTGCHSKFAKEKTAAAEIGDGNPHRVFVAHGALPQKLRVGPAPGDTVEIVRFASLPGNINLIVAEEPLEQYIARLKRDVVRLAGPRPQPYIDRILKGAPCAPTDRHCILSVNWFSPSSLRDWLTLGFRLVTQNALDSKYRMLGPQFLQIADDLLWSPELYQYLGDRHVAAPDSPVRLITTCGFSMGAAVAQALAFLLRESKKLRTAMRSVGIGSPRVGGASFGAWFRRELEFGSANVLLMTSEDGEQTRFDPATTYPSLKDGFDHQPVCVCVDVQNACCFAVKNLPQTALTQDTSVFRSLWSSIPGMDPERDLLWKELHSITKYYAAFTHNC